MAISTSPTKNDAGDTSAPNVTTVPSINLPKGGGAIRGVGEKFGANPVNGSASFTVPIATSAGRSGFGPALTLSYDSGSGNSPFGFGWKISTPSITRKTSLVRPRYVDTDVFLISDAEDLVPELRKDVSGSWTASHAGHRRDPIEYWVSDSTGNMLIHEDEIEGYRVRRYRPRIEGLFARIERWTKLDNDADVHWRSISKDNVLTIYGADGNSRIADPDSQDRIFSWLICETRDDKGNAIIYRYKAEDGEGANLQSAHQRNRGPRDDARRTANRYLKRIFYGNQTPVLDAGQRPRFINPATIDAQVAAGNWMFEVVFDYGEHDTKSPLPNDPGPWWYRPDAFSSYRSGFEVRTARLVRRALMFHHFPGVAGVERNCLVRSTDFEYSTVANPPDPKRPVYSFLKAVKQIGYRRNGADYDPREMPPITFEYSQPSISGEIEEVDRQSLENLPIGIDENSYRWVDLHGEGLPGIVSEQGGAWFYKRNLSPVTPGNGNGQTNARFAPVETVALQPNATLAAGSEFMDLAGDGLPDLVMTRGPAPGFFEHDEGEGWQPFRAFESWLNYDFKAANLKLIDLDGDARADVLISAEEDLIWHISDGERGFGPSRRAALSQDEQKGPRSLCTDSSTAVFAADMCGDGCAAIVRIRNGEVSFWANCGHGKWAPLTTMDFSPVFDDPEHFDPKRLRLADIDGSGTTDIVYLHREGVRVYFNQCGNSWSVPTIIDVLPSLNDIAHIVPLDLLGNGTACLVWSSPLPNDAGRQMSYVRLMDRKPHLLEAMDNHLGAKTRVTYASSTKFYLEDKLAGRPWITKLPFPVHVVEKVETFDQVSGNVQVSTMRYRHGFYDGEEREFRGFAMVEQWDAERLGIAPSAVALMASNRSPTSDVPPIHTKTWFHTGVYLGRNQISDYFAGLVDAEDTGEYFREPGVGDVEVEQMLLRTIPPDGLTLEEEREACRALKGTMLRQEIYADDADPGASEAERQRALIPYAVTEQNFKMRRVQPFGPNPHAVIFVHPSESLQYHYERNAVDPRLEHRLTMEVDEFGNTLKEAAIAYARRARIRVRDAAGAFQTIDNPGLLALAGDDRTKQTTPLLTYTETLFANAIDTSHSHRNPSPAETRTFELRNYPATGQAGRYQERDLVEPDPTRAGRLQHRFAADEPYESAAAGPQQRRLIECVRTLYRADNLGALLPLGTQETLSLAGEFYKLAFSPGLLSNIYRRPWPGSGSEILLPDPLTTLGSSGGGRGGYVASETLKADGLFPATDPNGHYWIPSGRTFFTTVAADAPAVERSAAEQSFFLPRRYRDPFGIDAFVAFDAFNLLMIETRDFFQNRVTVEENDYRVLQPRRVRDPNGNRTEVAFDILGLLAGTAVMGRGDSLQNFVADLDAPTIAAFVNSADPRPVAAGFLQNATTRIVYDLDRFWKSRDANPLDPTQWQPAFAATIARETHVADTPGAGVKTQLSFAYSDGFGREAQKKLQAEPIPAAGGGARVDPRWVGSGWTIYNNKGKPVQKFEPFFSTTHQFESGRTIGVSATLFYDPPGRVIATIHPNATYEKAVFDAWGQTNYDVNDTCAPRGSESGDPRTDRHIAGYVRGYFEGRAGWATWRAQRIGGALGMQEMAAATRAEAHADTPTTSHFDGLGRVFLTVARNRVVCAGHDLDGAEGTVETRVELDIEGNQREVRDAIQQRGDARGRIVMQYDYDMLGNRIRQVSMDAGARWMLNDVTGKPIRAWDARGHNFTTVYDELRRPIEQYVRGTAPASDPRTLGRDTLVEKIEYGEQSPNPEAENLRTRVWRRRDSAGLATSAYDFKGNLARATRQIPSNYKILPDWLAPPDLDDELAFETRTSFDALNRAAQSITPHTSGAGALRNIIQPVYNEAGLLERMDVWLERGADPAALLNAAADPPSNAGVSNIDYNAKGQRVRIDYKNGASTFYDYNPQTFLLSALYTRRGAAFTGDCENPNPPPDTIAAPDTPLPGRACGLQNLRYFYDPAGNITQIRDDSQQTIFFQNRRVEPSNEYTYDALYRLIQATGREHLGQNGIPSAHSSDDAGRSGLVSQDIAGRFAPNDGNAMGTYLERYVYDAVGNILRMQHRGGNAGLSGWSRAYTYDETSVIEFGGAEKKSNRLTRTTVNPDSGLPAIENYLHDLHGNMVRMPHLGAGAAGPNMKWDYKDRLVETNLGGGGSAFFVYDASGERVRKVWEKAPGLTEERIYLGGFEIYRRHNGPIGQNTAALQRETLHVMDDKSRIAIVETRTRDDAAHPDRAPRQTIRYQLANHLGSSAIELDETARIITFEEYSPYGSTTYQSVRNENEAPKRYRYTGKERDEETGMQYYGARYYAAWIARWTSADPKWKNDVYVYSANRPTVLLDPDGREESSTANRLWGAVRIVGGTAQTLVGAAVFAQVEVPVAAQVVGGVAMVHGMSDIQAGFRQLVTGHEERSVIEQTVTVTAQAMGASDQTARALGTGVDVGLGFVSPVPASGGPGAMGALSRGRAAVITVEAARATEATRIAQSAQPVQLATNFMMAATRSGGNSSSGSSSSSGGGGSSGPSTPSEPSPSVPDEFFDEAMTRIDEGGFEAAGAHLDDLTNHAQSPLARAERGVTGQSAHISARSAMRGVEGYNPRAALTRLLDSTTHQGFDNYWKGVFRQMARSGQREISVRDYFNTMRDAIGANPHFTNAEANSMVELLRDELFVQHGLTETDMLRLPYSR